MRIYYKLSDELGLLQTNEVQSHIFIGVSQDNLCCRVFARNFIHLTSRNVLEKDIKKTFGASYWQCSKSTH